MLRMRNDAHTSNVSVWWRLVASMPCARTFGKTHWCFALFAAPFYRSIVDPGKQVRIVSPSAAVVRLAQGFVRQHVVFSWGPSAAVRGTVAAWSLRRESQA